MVDVELVPPPSATTCDSLELADPASITESTTVVAIEDVSTTENETAEPRALAQVEFYFADSNLPYDKFMWSLHTANEEHWVPIATIASFKRMREFQPRSLEWVADVLRTSTELEVSEDGTKVRRRTEVQEPKGSFDRSVYAKGFGDEVPGLQRLLEQFFSKYGKVAAVRMRRVDGTKAFKGSVFTEFVEYKGVEAFLKADPQPSWDGKELLTMSKEAYVEMKIEEKGLKGKAAVVRRDRITRKGFNAFHEVRLAAEGKKGKKDTEKAKPEIFVEFLGAKLRVLEEDGGSIVPEDVPRVRGSALRFAGCGGEVLFDEIKRPLKEHFSRVPFVKFTRGDDAGLVGFDKALNEEDIAFVKEKIPTLNGKPILWELPEEEEEHTFSIERANAAAKRALGVTEGGNRGGRGGRAARGGRRERGGRSERGTRSGKRGGGIARTQNGKDEQAGEKRKRAVEADGGHDIGARGETVPTVVTAPAPKKAKTEGGES
ncbi:hypothetical protein B0F90DRAFT_1818951 [Multifurca ochricompacta]|uniref:Uncharacterized protein n=1 Tax=Multifurca ochricompacta TaxID=376703 RepID=A0AAD4M106_9AGAM|nr:hypothetical protein B0F90DRAFT_1818951 [Multifurca ochricompacta]